MLYEVITVMRYFFLHRRSVARVMEIFFWPVMNLLVWGFVTHYLKELALPKTVLFLLGSVILWDVLYRSQQGIRITSYNVCYTKLLRPAGGCLLTDKTFSRKVRDLFDHCADPDMTDIHLLKIGRHFRFPDGRKVIVARNEEENRKLEALGRRNNFV